MHLRIVILIALSFYLQAGHLNLLLAQKATKQDTVQVRVDNHKMSMYVSGTGKYTVVLEAGGSSNHRCYSSIDTAIAKITRVISYDRPGYLKPEICNKTRDAITIAKDFCDLYPADVVGLVLLDPCPEDFYTRMLKEHPELMKEDSIYMQEILTSTDRPGEKEEMMSFDTSMQQAKSSTAADIIPTTLLIAAYGKIPGDGEKDPNNPMNFIWVDELKKWAASRPNLQYTVLENSGHHISKEHPDVVIKAITDMIVRIK